MKDPSCVICGKVFELRSARQKTCSAECGLVLKRETSRQWNRNRTPEYRYMQKHQLLSTCGPRVKKRLLEIAQDFAPRDQCRWCGDDCVMLPDDPYCSDDCRWDDAAELRREAR